MGRARPTSARAATKARLPVHAPNMLAPMEAAGDDLRRKRQQLLSFLLRHSRIYSGGGHWTLAHRRWLAGQKFDHAA
jgi:transposase